MKFPWQKKQWQQLWQAKQEQRLPHALLFTGMAGIGKTQFADSFVCALLCQELAAEEACGQCHACRLIAGKAHPNVLWVAPEKEGQAIKVEQIRHVSEFIYQTSLQGDFRIVIIHPANKMNIHAANALLKMLEEPPLGAIIILISDQTSPLPATLLSRCQRFVFPSPPLEQALPWLKEQLENEQGSIGPVLLLKLNRGAPLGAIQWVKTGKLAARLMLYQHLYALTQKPANPLPAALNVFENMDILPFLDFMLSWELDLIRLQWGANVNEITNIDFASQLMEIAKYKERSPHLAFLTFLERLYAQICLGMNMNKQLLVESVLIKYIENYP